MSESISATTLEAADAPEERGSKRQRWIVVLSSAAAVAVMAGVIVLAKAGASAHDPVEDGTSPNQSGLHVPERHPVGPTALDPFPDGCEVDYDHPPKMVLDVPAAGVDFGSIKQGVKAEYDLVVRNDGTGTLCLRKPTTGCGCVKAHLIEEQRKIEPGKTGVVKIILDSTGREGVVSKSLTISSNDPETPSKTITVRAEVSLGLVVTGIRVDFGTVAKDQPGTATVRLRSHKADAAWQVSGVENVAIPGPGRPEPALLTYEAKEVEDPTWRVVDLTVRHPGSATYGSIGGQVRIRTTHPDRPEIVMPSWMQVVASVMASPPNASLGFVPRAGSARVRLLPQHPEVTFKVTGAVVKAVEGQDPGPDGPGFLIEYTQAQGGVHKRGEWWVDIKYDGKSRKSGQRLRAEAIVTTDAPDAAEIRIPITATVK